MKTKRASPQQQTHIIAPSDDASGPIETRSRDLNPRSTNQRMEQSEELLKLTMATAQMGMWDWDILHDTFQVSSTYYTMLGYTPRAGLADRTEWLMRVHPDDRTFVDEKIQTVLRGNSNDYQYEARLRHADGTYRWQHIRGFEFNHDDSGKAIRMVGVRIDINDRKIAEVMLENKESEFRSLAEHFPDNVVRYDTKGRLVYVNPSFEKWAGLPASAMIGKTTAESFPTEAGRMYHHKLLRVLETGEEEDFTFSIPNREGGDQHHHVRFIIERGPDNTVTGLKVIGRNFTDHKQAQDQLLLRDFALNKAHEAVFFIDDQLHFFYVNEEACRALGYSREELLTMSIPDIDPTVTPDKEIFFRNTMKAPYTVLFETRHKRRNGETFPVEINTTIFDYQGKMAVLSLVRDITGKKKTEEEVAQYRYHLEELVEQRTKELETANRLLTIELNRQKEIEQKMAAALAKEQEVKELRSQFISQASHEFRTPLTTIYSSAQLLERYGRSWEEKTYQEQVRRIQEYVHYLVDIIDDVLLLNKADANKLHFHPTVTNLNELCNSCRKEVEALLSPRHHFSIVTALSRELFFLDEKLLKLIIINLLSNAIKYSPQGGKITLHAEDDARSVRISVSDEGIGIPHEDQKHLFDPFHRGRNTGDISGTGLGMSIIKRALDMHNGEIEFVSTLGAGSSFTVTLPVRDE